MIFHSSRSSNQQCEETHFHIMIFHTSRSSNQQSGETHFHVMIFHISRSSNQQSGETHFDISTLWYFILAEAQINNLERSISKLWYFILAEAQINNLERPFSRCNFQHFFKTTKENKERCAPKIINRNGTDMIMSHWWVGLTNKLSKLEWCLDRSINSRHHQSITRSSPHPTAYRFH